MLSILLKGGGAFVLFIQPLGHPARGAIKEMRAALESTYSFELVMLKPARLPQAAWYAPRKRWRADILVHQPFEHAPNHVLYVTSEDISDTARGKQDWGVLGFAQGNAVVSTFRIHGRKKLWHDVTIHEIGHVLGLPHCTNPQCVMQDLQGKAATLNSANGFCASCRARLAGYLR